MADDVIGTVGRICSANGWECVIVTGDRDSLQLIDENVHVKLVISKPGQTTATLYDGEKFREEYGFEPKKLIDLKALMGDSSDNIPGVAGVGPKTAKELLAQFGSLDGVYAHLDDPAIRPKLREKLEAGRITPIFPTILPPSARRRPLISRPRTPSFSPTTVWSCTICSPGWNLSGSLTATASGARSRRPPKRSGKGSRWQEPQDFPLPKPGAQCISPRTAAWVLPGSRACWR